MDATLFADFATAGEGTTEEVWLRSEDAVRTVTRKFARYHGKDFEECFSEALLHFMRAVNDWPKRREGCGNWWLHLRRHIWYGLFDTYRRDTQARCKTKIKFVESTRPELMLEPDYFDAEALFDNVGEDAVVALRLVFDMPDDLKAAAVEKGGTPRNFRSCLRSYLLELGWGTERVNDVFLEIRTALS